MTGQPGKGTALITAGARRVGRHFSLALADQGYDIAVHFNGSREEAEGTADEVRKRGRNCQVFQADFNDLAQTKALLPAVQKSMAPLTVLINNASIFNRINLLETSIEEYDVNFNVHVRAPFILIQEFAKHCQDGHVINIVDTTVTRSDTSYFAYLLSKKTLLELTRMAAQELAPAIRVNAIAPGLILAPDVVEHERYKHLSGKNLLRHEATLDDVVHALNYFLTSTHVTGDCLFVDGGDHVSV